MSSLMKPENADSLKLEIWREIMRQRGEYTPGHSTLMGGGNLNYVAPPNPITSAETAVKTFNALYPDPPSTGRAKRKSGK